jgi:hypothetical protein
MVYTAYEQVFVAQVLMHLVWINGPMMEDEEKGKELRTGVH